MWIFTDVYLSEDELLLTVTPRDHRDIFDEPLRQSDPNFRFKGYPDKRFEGSRNPVYGRAPDDTELQGVKLSEIQGSELRSRKQFFDPSELPNRPPKVECIALNCVFLWRFV